MMKILWRDDVGLQRAKDDILTHLKMFQCVCEFLRTSQEKQPSEIYNLRQMEIHD